jgi:hypothetical protein
VSKPTVKKRKRERTRKQFEHITDLSERIGMNRRNSIAEIANDTH